MDFKLNREQEAIQKAARDFAQGEFDKEIALEHERTHVDQYVRKGPIRSIDDMALRELEAYQNGLDQLLKDKKKLNCN